MAQKGLNIYIGPTSIHTCLGNKTETLSNLEKGNSGLKFHQDLGMYAGTLSINVLNNYTRFESLLIEQIESVLRESKIQLSDSSTLLVISTTKGNIDLLESNTDTIDERAFLASSAKAVSEYFHCANTPITISNACISGLSAIIYAKDLLKAGKYKHVVIAGCDILSKFITSGFSSFKSISPKPCKPYDNDRDGLSLGEAAGALILTTDQEFAAKPLIKLLGGSITNDANHISGPSRTGDGLFYAIDNAVKEANFSYDKIGFINAHGTATRYNDEMESKAINWAKLNAIPINSLKGYLGHTLGASGVIETIISIEELNNNWVYGTKGFDVLGTPFNIQVSADKQPISKPTCLKTASGFGGCNAAILLSKECETNFVEIDPRDVQTIATYSLPQSELPFGEFIRNEYKTYCKPNMKFYKMSDMSKALYVATERLLESVPEFDEIEPLRKAIILANRAASLDSDIQHQQIINQNLPEGASPSIFVYTLPNVSTGEMCIRHKIKGNNTFFIENEDTGIAEKYAKYLIETHQVDYAICGWCDFLQNKWNVNIKLLKFI